MAAGLIATSATQVAAQPPRQQTQVITQARQACDAAASRNGYQVMRRDREVANGSSYDLPLHVSHAGAQADITCRYDAQRGIADLPRWEDRLTAGHRFDRTESMAQSAQTTCQNFVNTKRGYQVQQVGTPTRHGQNLWDVPVTVRRNNGRRDQTVTCRYNAASNKVSLR
jgi:hypothetical protein